MHQTGETISFLTAGYTPKVLTGVITRVGEDGVAVQVGNECPQLVPITAIVPTAEVAEQCDRVIALMVSEYRASGHLYDGCVTVDFVAAKLDIPFAYAAYLMGVLVGDGRVLRRDCEAVSYELPEWQRLQLGVQVAPNDYRIFNQVQADGSYRPLSEFFRVG